MNVSKKTSQVLALIISLVVIISSQETTQDPNVCYKTLDIVFVLDGSNSLGSENFRIVKDTTVNAVEVLSFGENSTRVGAVLYSTIINAVIELKTDKLEFQAEVNKFTYPDEGTYTNLGIDRARQMLIASRRPDVPIVIVIVTDGASSEVIATNYSALVASSQGISIFGVGVGYLADLDELSSITTNGRLQTFNASTFLEFQDRLQNVTRIVCNTAVTLPTFTIPTTTPEATTESTTLTTTTIPPTTTVAETTTTIPPTTTVAETTTTIPPTTTVAETTTLAVTTTVAETTTLSSTTAATPTTNDSNTGIDICKNSPSIGGVGYVLYPGDCSKVLQCYYNPNTNKTLVVTRQCPSGQFWDQSCLKCIDSWKVDCPYDKCKSDPCYGNDTATSTYPMAGVCGGFWSCENGRSYPKCCPPCFSYMVGYGCKFGNTCFDRCGPDVGCTDGLGVCEKIPEWENVTNYALASDSQGLTTNTCVRSNLSIVDCKCQTKLKDTFMQEGQECTPSFESTSPLACSGQLSYPIKQNTDVGTVAIKIRIRLNAPRFNITSTPVSAQTSNSSELKIWADETGIYASIGDTANGGVVTSILLKNLTGDVELTVMIHQGLFTLGVSQDKFQQVSNIRVKSMKLCVDCIHNFAATADNGGCLVNKVLVYNCKPELTTIYTTG